MEQASEQKKLYSAASSRAAGSRLKLSRRAQELDCPKRLPLCTLLWTCTQSPSARIPRPFGVTP